ncbi:T9SS type A sorting domain-containing protein [bacterium]|nr:T9SS type A sorting domain-containing protein [bacterium]
MRTKISLKKVAHGYGITTIILLIIMMVPSLYGQDFNFKDLTRGKLWARIWNTSAVGQPTLGGAEFYKFDYPGHMLGTDMNDHYGMCEWSGWMAWANVDGVGVPFRVCMAYDPNPMYIAPIEDTKLIKNYNLADPTTPAEEIITGANLIKEYGVEMHFKAMAWSAPKYDDFIIYEFIFRNTGNHEITNFRFAPTAELSIATPIVGGWNDDDVYEWDKKHQAFYFHDGRLWNTDSEPVTYSYGLTKRDLGDPADLDAPNAIDHEFQSPQYFTYYWLDKPTKSDPSERDHMNVVDKGNLNQEWNRVQLDPMNDDPEVDFDPDDYILRALKYDQPLPPTTEGGQSLSDVAANLGLTTAPRTLYERQIDYLYETGPYDLPPGGELKFVMVAAAGMMDFSRVAAGGLENEAHLKDGADSLWAHIDAAEELYQRNYQYPLPPPTPTDGMNTLTITPMSEGQMIKIQWPPISDDYVDPDYGVNDFAGYRVYRSNFRNVGPWELIADIPKEQVTMEDGMVTYNDKVILGVGYYYGVTSYDTGHNAPWPPDPSITSLPKLESGLVNANLEPVYAMSATSNNLNDVRVYPNPFRQHSKLRGTGEQYRLEFVNIPAKCTIRIYTLAGELVRTIKHDDGSGSESWGSKALADYQVNRYLQYVAPGVYLFQVESEVKGHKGDTKIGKFLIIK